MCIYNYTYIYTFHMLYIELLAYRPNFAEITCATKNVGQAYERWL